MSVAIVACAEAAVYPEAKILPPLKLVPVILYSTALLAPALTQVPPAVVPFETTCQL